MQDLSQSWNFGLKMVFCIRENYARGAELEKSS